MDGHRPYILVVDDLIDSADSLAALLPYWGYDVGVCYEGATAVESIRRRKPDLVILDLAMPRMDGFELLVRLRALKGCERVEVVAVTGQTNELHQARCRKFGVKHYLLKPVDPNEMRTLLQGLVIREKTHVTLNPKLRKESSKSQGCLVT